MTKLHPLERATDIVALGALTSPMWLDALTYVSELSGLLLPILGSGWLLIQMFYYIKSGGKKDDH